MSFQFGGFIRGMQEARDALASVLALPERRQQIIQIMQRIVMCMTRDTRRFLSDAMAGLIEGGLEYMRAKRREAIEARRKREAERIQADPAAAAEAARKAEEDRVRRQKEDEARRRREELERRRQEEAERWRREEEERRRAAEAAEFEALEAFEPAEIEPPAESPEPVAELPPPPPPEPEPAEPYVILPGEEPKPEPAPEPVAELPPAPEEPAEPYVIVDEQEMKEIEEIGTELDALSLADVAREVFPDLKNLYEPWEVARAIYMDEAAARKAVLQGARLKDQERATMLAPALDDMKRLIENKKPFWRHSLPSIKECIDLHFKAEPPVENRATPEQVFNVIAMADAKATSILKVIMKSNDPGVEVVAQVRRRLDKLIELEEEKDG